MYNVNKKIQSFTSKVTDSNYDCVLNVNLTFKYVLHQSQATLLFFLT